MGALKYIVLIAVCVLVVLALFVFVGYMGWWPNVVSDWVLPKMPDLASGNYTTTILSGIGGAATVGSLAYSQIGKLKSQATQAKTAADTQISNLTSQAETAKAKLATAEEKLTSTETELTNLKNAAPNTEQITNLQNQVQSLTNQNQQLNDTIQKQYTNMAETAKVLQDPSTKELWQAVPLKKMNIN